MKIVDWFTSRAGSTDAETHIHHALVTVLLFGTLGGAIGLLREAPEIGFRAGMVVGLSVYLLRELRQKAWLVGRWWDAVCDIVIPCWIVLPVALDAPWLLWVGAAVVAVLYIPLRGKA